MKIKTKKQLNLPQLIEWAWKNGIKNKNYISENHYLVAFDKIGFMQNSTLPLDEVFTVEVEEEITEDTALDKLYHTTTLSRIVESGCSTIKSTLEHSTVEPIAFYMLNDDLTMTLIWRDGKLVE